MSEEKRDIEDILNFRSDISPFLIHLTKDKMNNGDVKKASKILKEILEDKQLKQGETLISDAKYGANHHGFTKEKRHNLFSSISFTETPINEIHCLIKIKNREVDLRPYGLVFIKDNLMKKNVSPVIYLNNYGGEIQGLINTFGSFINEDDYSEELNKFYPLFSIMGQKVKGTYASRCPDDDPIDFYWEREWRYPYCYGSFEIDARDVFVGLCKHDDISSFEALAKQEFSEEIPFIDPMRNVKWYARKLIERRNKFNMKTSVV